MGHALGERKSKKFIMKLCIILNTTFGFICALVTVFAGGTPAKIWAFGDFATTIPTFVNILVLIF